MQTYVRWLVLYLIYIDESGKANKKDQTPLYVQAAFILLDDDWQSVDNSVNALKAKWFPSLPPSDVEFHAYEIVQQKGLYKSLGQAKSFSLLQDLYDLIAQTNCTLVASVIFKKRLWKLKTQDEIELWSHRFLFERVCKYLDKDNAKRIQRNESPHYGILLIDSVNSKYDNTIRRKYHSFFEWGTYFQSNTYLIEDPLFVDSQYRNMSQLVDLVAYTINRRTNAKQKVNKSIIDQVAMKGYQTILPKFDKSVKGRFDGYGIKYFP